jgi:hypothetical protein
MSYGSIETSIDDFCDLVSALVPFCPEFLKQRAVRESLAEFFEQTRTWREIIEEQPACAGDIWFDANALARRVSSHALALAVDDVLLSEDKTRISKLDIAEMDSRQPGWMADTADEPTGFLVYNTRKIRLYPAMDGDAEDCVDLDIELVLTCDGAIETIPDYVFQFHKDAIVNGACWRLAAMPGMPWSDSGRAAFFIEACQAEINDATAEQAKRAIDAVNMRSHRRFFG